MPHRKMLAPAQKLAALLLVVAVCGAIGCGQSEQAEVVPVSGSVLLDGKPLEFGSVTFQPMRGQPARGTIGKDGTFKLSTYREGDGAAVGQHLVKITCYASQDPAAAKTGPSETLGESLIPVHYASFETSGLRVAVLAGGNKPFVLELKSEPKEAEVAKESDAKDASTGDATQAGDAVQPADEAKPADDTLKPAEEAVKSAPADAGATGQPATTEPAAEVPSTEAKTDAK